MKIFLLLFLTSSSLLSQVHEEWIKKYNGTNSYIDYSESMVIDRSGNIYVTGFSSETGSGNDYCTIKYSSSGIQKWIRLYNGPKNGNDYASSIAVNDSGDVYVTGYSYRGVGGNSDFCTVKYDSIGNQKWAVRYNGKANLDDFALAVAVDKMGFVYITGYSKTVNSEDDIVTIKYNTLGEKIWESSYNGPYNSEDGGIALSADNLGNVYVAGESYSPASNYDFITLKYNSVGSLQWTMLYDGPGNFDDAMKKIALDRFGNVIISGKSSGIDSKSDFATIKYNSDGVQQWVSRFNGPANLQDIPSDMRIDTSGNIYITGESRAADDMYKIITLKYDKNGVEQWYAIEDNGNYGVGHSLALDYSGNVYTAGYEFIDDYAEMVTLKYNSNGNRIWRINYDGNKLSNNYNSGIVADNAGDIYVAGTSNNDFVTIKYSQSVGINSTNTQISEKYFLAQNYPNPFNPTTNIIYSLTKDGFVTIKVFDVDGKMVKELVSEFKETGNYSIVFDGSSFASGLYFYRIESNNFIDTKRMVLIK
ncbi:MAG: SBBP repeat-containing protein [Ignavibacteria bacterium]|nr:SBBP repeat-containing protein [Ignavibacteria bacterium]